MIKRSIEGQIEDYLKGDSNKILFIWGPRRSGKTTLLKKYSKELGEPIFNFDLQSHREDFLPDLLALKKIVDEHKVILIDEVQNYPESSLALKILFDEFKVKIIATGSSELRQTSKDFDSLAGRFSQIYCLPLSVSEVEISEKVKAYERKDALDKYRTQGQIFGMYPEVYLADGGEIKKTELLQNLLDTYVLKDVIDIYNLKNAKLAKDILTKIALQIGSEVSVREIASSLQANVATVSSYIEIFVKNYILIPLSSFKTNKRKSVSELRKLYFYDLGIRNILVRDFRPLELRPDKGGVFENFVIAEVEKKRRIGGANLSTYFYREYGGKEIDLVLEDYHKNYTCVEIKTKKEKAQDVFPLPHKLEVMTGENYFEKIEGLFV
jgi:predicted AAA+ superfamily ATPase